MSSFRQYKNQWSSQIPNCCYQMWNSDGCQTSSPHPSAVQAECQLDTVGGWCTCALGVPAGSPQSAGPGPVKSLQPSFKEIRWCEGRMMGGPASAGRPPDNVCPLIKASPSLWSQQRFSNKTAPPTLYPPTPLQSLLRRQLHCCHPTSTSKDPQYYYYFLFISLFAHVSCRQLTQQKMRRVERPPTPDSPGVLVNIPCAFYFSPALCQTAAAATSLKKKLLLQRENTRVDGCDPSFTLHARPDLNTWMWFSLYIQPTLCFALPCLVGRRGGSYSAAAAKSSVSKFGWCLFEDSLKTIPAFLLQT